MFESDLILSTEEVTLRPLKLSDLGSLTALTSDKSMWTYFTSNLSDEAELKSWVETAVKQTNEKTRLAFAVVNNPTGEIMGSTSFGNLSVPDKRVEIGWTWLAKAFQGKGVNKQIKYLMLKYGFENCGMERIEIKTDVLNIPARKALIRIGATEEGILRSHTIVTNNRRRDTIYYSILLNEWEGLKTTIRWF